MGRSSGGSTHSGGGFGGGRSSGGFSGGGRSSGGGFGRRPSPGPRPGPGYGPRPMWGMRRPMYGGFWGRRYGTGCGCGGGLISLVIIFFLFIMLSGTYGCTSCVGGIPFISNNSSNSNVEQSENVREPLEGVVSKTDWYDDQLGWISSENVLIEGLEDFYKETGIQPYVMFVPYSADLWNGENLNPTAADQYLENVYEERFEDEGHFIFAYFQCENDSKQEMEGEFRYLSGYSVDTIMDNEAISIFWGYFEANYYNTSLSIEEMISDTFTQTANNIMQKSEDSSSSTVPMVLSIIIISILVIVVIYSIVKNKRNKNNIGNKPEDIIIENNDEKNN